jgi:hypothetical protein
MCFWTLLSVLSIEFQIRPTQQLFHNLSTPTVLSWEKQPKKKKKKTEVFGTNTARFRVQKPQRVSCEVLLNSKIFSWISRTLRAFLINLKTFSWMLTTPRTPPSLVGYSKEPPDPVLWASQRTSGSHERTDKSRTGSFTFSDLFWVPQLHAKTNSFFWMLGKLMGGK